MGHGWQISALALLIVAVLMIASVAGRRYLLARQGAIDLCWRDQLTPDGRGWYLGLAKFDGPDLHLYRSFSLLPLPNRTLHRTEMTLGTRRWPIGTETDLLPQGAMITRCTVGPADRKTQLELGMSAEAGTGLRSWLESVPPSNRSTGRLKHTGPISDPDPKSTWRRSG